MSVRAIVVFCSVALAACGGKSGGGNNGGGSDGGGGDGGQPRTARLIVQLGGAGGGSVTSAPAGINCGNGGQQCQATFNQGTAVTLTASPAGGATFAGWSGGGCSGTGTCKLTLSADTTVTATFDATSANHTLTVSTTGNGQGQVTSTPAGIDCGAGTSNQCSAQLAGGTQVTLTASPASGSTFTGWSGPCSGTGPCTLTMSTDQNVTAGFSSGGSTYTLTVSRSFTGGATGDVTSSPSGINCGSNCTATFAAGTTVTLTPTPGSGFSFGGWSGACSGTGACTVVMNSDQSVGAAFGTSSSTTTLTVNVGGMGTGTVTSSPAGISCALGACSASFATGTAVTLTATPGGGQSFSGWGGDCTGTGTCTVTMDVNHSVSATFVAQPTLTVSVGGTGSGTVDSSPPGISCSMGSCSASFAPGTVVTLTATPGVSSAFAGWTGGGCSGTGTCTVTMTGSQFVSASFGPVRTLTVTLAGTGTVTSTPAGLTCAAGTCTGSFADGSQVVLDAVPGANYAFTGWGGACNGTGSCTVWMMGDQSATATFTRTYTLTATISGPAGSGSVSGSPGSFTCSSGTCTTAFTTGTSVTLYASPMSGFAFTGWGGDCTGTATSCALGMTGDHTVTASFVPTHQLTVSITGSGNVTSAPAGITCPGSYCSATFNEGSSVTLTAHEYANSSSFTGWGGACSGTAPCTLVMNADATVSANFVSFALSTALPIRSLVPGESRTLGVTVTLQAGQAAPVALSASGLPAGVTASFSPATVTPPATSTMTLSAGSSAVPGQYPVDAVGTNGTLSNQAPFTLEIRSPYGLNAPYSVALEAGGTTALVTDADRIVRVTTADMTVTKTIVSELPWPHAFDLAVEAGGATALVGLTTGLARVNLATGALSMVAALNTDTGVAIEGSGGTALALDCVAGDCNNARLVRVDLSSGAVTNVTPTGFGLKAPHSIALEAGGATALVAEAGANRLIRVDLASGSILTIATGYSFYGVAITGPSTAIVSGNGWNNPVLARVNLDNGNQTFLQSEPCCSPNLQGVAVEPGGKSVLAADMSNPPTGRLLRLDITRPLDSIAPSPRWSADTLFGPRAVAVEATGTSALVTDDGPTGTGRLSRVDLASGVVTAITPSSQGFAGAWGVAVEASGKTALGTPVIGAAAELVRVDIDPASGTYGQVLNTIAANPNGFFGIAIEPGGTSALVTGDEFNAPSLSRVNLTTGARTILFVTSWPFGGLLGVAVEASGKTALVANYGVNGIDRGELLRFDIDPASPTYKSYTVVANGLQRPRYVQIESGGTSVLVSEQGTGGGRITRVNLATGQRTILASGLNAPTGLSLEASGAALVLDQNQLFRVTTGSPIAPKGLTRGVDFPGGISLEAGGTALTVVCSDFNTTQCLTAGQVLRVDSSTSPPTITSRATGLNSPQSVAVEASGTTALVTDCGPSGTTSCGTLGRVLRVDLGTGSISQRVTGLSSPTDIVVEAAGTALVAETGAGRLLRVNPGTGSYGVIVAGLNTPHQVYLEAGGATALVGVYNAIVRVDLVAKTVTPLVNWNVKTFAVDSGGATAIMAGAGVGLFSQFARVNLATGAVSVLMPGFFDSANFMVMEPGGTSALFTEYRGIPPSPSNGNIQPGSGALYRLPVPPP